MLFCLACMCARNFIFLLCHGVVLHCFCAGTWCVEIWMQLEEQQSSQYLGTVITVVHDGDDQHRYSTSTLICPSRLQILACFTICESQIISWGHTYHKGSLLASAVAMHQDKQCPRGAFSNCHTPAFHKWFHLYTCILQVCRTSRSSF